MVLNENISFLFTRARLRSRVVITHVFWRWFSLVFLHLGEVDFRQVLLHIFQIAKQRILTLHRLTTKFLYTRILYIL